MGGKGSVDNHGNGVDNTYGIRPVLHINLSSSAWAKGEKVSAGDTSTILTTNPPQTASPTGDTTTASPAGNILDVISIVCKKNAKKITGKLSISGATVKIKVGKKPFKKAEVKGKKFTLKLSYRLKKKTRVQVKATKSGYKAFKKKYVVK